MQNLIKLEIDPFQAYQAIVEAKSQPLKGRLLQKNNQIEQEYQRYNANVSELAVMTPIVLNKAEQADLKHCYESATNALSDLTTKIKQAQSGTTSQQCQYCCLGQPTSIDHYLAKSKFPEFSVHAFNLIPCCPDCNNFKGGAFLAGNNREIVNLYFDRLPQDRYLFVDLTYRNLLPRADFRVFRHPAISAALIERIEAHFNRLQLYRRWSEYASTVISEAMSSSKAHSAKPLKPDTIANYLGVEAHRLGTEFSPNYWKAVLYEALSGDLQFIRSCCR